MTPVPSTPPPPCSSLMYTWEQMWADGFAVSFLKNLAWTIFHFDLTYKKTPPPPFLGVIIPVYVAKFDSSSSPIFFRKTKNTEKVTLIIPLQFVLYPYTYVFWFAIDNFVFFFHYLQVTRKFKKYTNLIHFLSKPIFFIEYRIFCLRNDSVTMSPAPALPYHTFICKCDFKLANMSVGVVM